MTENDRQLISEAQCYGRFRYYKIDELIERADTAEAREALRNIRHELYELMTETL